MSCVSVQRGITRVKTAPNWIDVPLAFNLTLRYIDDLLSINNHDGYFQTYVDTKYRDTKQ